ncbi:hypothetical protein MWU75_15325 [Ornithinimicrobium sp. F0845]|uniref:hypothetical protein n=1 Tax=Ornithinimicrobium sp. F0845 TaxID=2926412 RepID=UPI001FF2BA64|nr:hypothetical protein [Ornithinimicrobium sp. F0845]MCK0113518.1 hypothetical protein [Ornithinimicrobium sp. F0845]
MQHERVRNPHPWTFEIPLACALAVILVLVLGVHAGRATANLFAGGPLAWPHPTDLFSSLPALLGGDAAAGLADPPARVAGPAALRAWIIVAEVIALVLTGAAAILAMKRWGPGRLRGTASKAEATKLLGTSRLRRHRAIIRPDLYGKAH